MHRLGLIVALGLPAVLLLAVAKPITAHAADKKPKEAPTTELSLLEKDAGAAFGDWNIWRHDEREKAIFAINQKTGLAVYLPWSSNGWINYREKGGDWHVIFSKGDAEKQNRDDLKIDLFLTKKTSAVLETGKYKFRDWTVMVTKDAIEFQCAENDDRMTIRKSSGDVVHNKRTLGKK